MRGATHHGRFTLPPLHFILIESDGFCPCVPSYFVHTDNADQSRHIATVFLDERTFSEVQWLGLMQAEVNASGSASRAQNVFRAPSVEAMLLLQQRSVSGTGLSGRHSMLLIMNTGPSPAHLTYGAILAGQSKPEVEYVWSAPTSGGQIAVVGKGFGPIGTGVTVLLGGRNCPRAHVVFAQHAILCDAPPGAGHSLDVHVITDYGPIATCTVGARKFTYDGPIVSSVSDSPPSGGEIFLDGSNFGPFNTPIRVSIGMFECQDPVVIVQHARIKCTMPAGFGTNLDVVISVNGVLSSFDTLSKFSYRVPVSIPIPVPQNSADVVLQSSWVVMMLSRGKVVPSEAFVSVSKNWHIVVVAMDEDTIDRDWSIPNVHFLSVEAQKRLPFSVGKGLPSLQARRALGHLFAIKQGAEVIYETYIGKDVSADSLVVLPLNTSLPLFATLPFVHTSARGLGASAVHMPLPLVNPPALLASLFSVSLSRSWLSRPHTSPSFPIQHASCHAESDSLPDCQICTTGVAFPYAAIFDSYATATYPAAFWSLAAPPSLSQQQQHIWRSFISIRLLHDLNAAVAFVPGQPWLCKSGRGRSRENVAGQGGDIPRQVEDLIFAEELWKILSSWDGSMAAQTAGYKYGQGQGQGQEEALQVAYLQMVDTALREGLLSSYDASFLESWLADLADHASYSFPAVSSKVRPHVHPHPVEGQQAQQPLFEKAGNQSFKTPSPPPRTPPPASTLATPPLQGPSSTDTSQPTPYVSFVLGTRNDNYGGSLFRRFQVFLNGLDGLCTKWKLQAELLVVEWNPPPNRQRLMHGFAWPTECLAVRIIQVPADVHNTYNSSDRIPLYEYIAKNVGIRRARGHFIVATNQDVILSDALGKYLSERRLRPRTLYLSRRFNVNFAIPTTYSYEEIRAVCEGIGVAPLVVLTGEKRIRFADHIDIHSALLTNEEGMAPKSHADFTKDCIGDFMIMHRDAWAGIEGFPELHINSGIEQKLPPNSAAAGYRYVLLQAPLGYFHQDHSFDRFDRPVGNLSWEEDDRIITSGEPFLPNGPAWGLHQKSFPNIVLGLS
eukprot:CAMPEP_0184663536 /NCGR_PEP_ID=MMETSP0308-20130426/48505_1 /TAXON_ID=38269 /ORGANISM="Gloeochaete witrockiana, Strain SAG 46.84" /LENGTH=1061 /DNA_ID=CAMNT_0027106325 /DNA_START=470 /DNA_END=3655 /DNA_ORIENTATION=-